MTPPPPSTPRVLEIEGLRAVAAALVVLFHVWIGGVSGGVDVFFTVAGFLVTTTLLRHLDAGRPRVGEFLLGMGRRLLPAVVIAVLSITAVAFVLRSRVHWPEILEQAVASLTYWQNWWLANEAVDYLAPDQTQSYFQHFWAISMQGQFAILWLILAIATLLIARIARWPTLNVFTALVAATAAASLVFGIWQTAWNPEWAYFDSRARVWEYAAGSLVALVGRRVRFPTPVAGVIGWLAVAGLILTGWVATAADLRFPGVVALLPVGTAVLLLLCVRDAPAWGANGILRLRPLVWLGGLSYGVYLWHWPLLIAAKDLRGDVPIGIASGIAIVVGSLTLAWLTKALLERPLATWARRSAIGRGRVEGAVLASVAALALVATALGLAGTLRGDRAPSTAVHLHPAVCWGFASVDPPATCETAPAGQYLPNGDPRNDHPKINADCVTATSSTELIPCTFGDPDSPIRVAHIGNSHSASWFPALERIAIANGWRLDVYMKSACTFNAYVRPSNNQEALTTCSAWNDSLSDYLEAAPPYDMMVTSSAAHLKGFIGADGEVSVDAGIAGYLDVWQPIIDRGTKIVVIADYPVSDAETLDCALLDPAAECARPASDAVYPAAGQTIVKAATLLPDDVAVVDLIHMFCQDDRCPAVIGNVYVYKDLRHLTSTIAETITPYLEAELRALDGFWPKVAGS
jgi:peptidoglycan/LPS O-acetylase OafA/YrhL